MVGSNFWVVDNTPDSSRAHVHYPSESPPRRRCPAELDVKKTFCDQDGGSGYRLAIIDGSENIPIQLLRHGASQKDNKSARIIR